MQPCRKRAITKPCFAHLSSPAFLLVPPKACRDSRFHEPPSPSRCTAGNTRLSEKKQLVLCANEVCRTTQTFHPVGFCRNREHRFSDSSLLRINKRRGLTFGRSVSKPFCRVQSVLVGSRRFDVQLTVIGLSKRLIDKNDLSAELLNVGG